MPDEIEHGPRTDEPFLEINTDEGKGGGASTLIFTISIILLVLVSGFFVFYKFQLDASAKDKQQALNSVLDQLHSQNNKKIEDRANSLNSALDIIGGASKTKYSFKLFMDELTKKITNDTKLNSMSISESGLVTIDGQSASYRSVADLALALKSSSKLSNVEISGLSHSSDSSSVSFSLSAQIKDWKTASAGGTEGAANE